MVSVYVIGLINYIIYIILYNYIYTHVLNQPAEMMVMH